MIVAAVLVLAVILRLVAVNQSFWLDEAISALTANQYSYAGIISEFIKTDFHPPLYYILLKLWGDFLGYSEIAVRSLSVLFGLGVVSLAYLIVRELGGSQRWALLSSLFLATSPLHIYYSQEARMYSMAAFAAALSVYFFVRILKNGLLWDWLGFSVSLVFLISTDYVPLFLLPVFWLTPLLLRKNKSWILKLLIAHFPLIIIGIAWAPIFIEQYKNSEELLADFVAWKQVLGGATLKQTALTWVKFLLGRISFDNQVVYAAVVFLASIPFLTGFYLSFRERKREHSALWLWLTVPLALGILVSPLIPAFSYFRFLFILPAFYLLVSYPAGVWEKGGKLLMAGVLAVNLLSWVYHVANPRFHREDWRSAVYLVEQKVQENEIAFFEFPFPPAPWQWYSTGKLEAAGALGSFTASEEDKKRVADLANKRVGVWHFVYLRDLTDPGKLVGSALIDLGFIQREVYDFRGVGHIIRWEKIND